MRCAFFSCLLLSLLTCFPAAAQAQPVVQGNDTPQPPGLCSPRETGVPEALALWKDWVLHDREDRNCPRTAANSAQRRCEFPTRAALQINEQQAVFTQEWRLYAPGSVVLPYARNSWPANVAVNGAPAPVVEKKGKPVVFLHPGTYTLTGRLLWSTPPETLFLPAGTAQIQLTRDGVPAPFPRIESDGSLRLATRKQEKQAEDRQEVSLFRLIKDSVPMEVTTLVRLRVSGGARRIDLPQVLFPGAVPLRVDSPLPLSFEARDGISVQAVPGRWDVYVTTRLSGPKDALGPAAGAYGTEFWAFQAQSDLRVVQLQGAPSVDPSTIDFPNAWKRYPAFLIEPKTTLNFKAMHRGAARNIPDDWRLTRELWLDFDGRGLTARDNISGTLRKRSRLAMRAPGELGRVTVNNKDQSIVLLGADKLPGVILTENKLNMNAVSRYEHFSGALPSVGWDQDVNALSATLHLPPGWNLFAAKGVDTASDTWLSKWNLLDIFLALLFSLAIFKLKSPLLGALALLFFAIGFHEYGTPKYSWIFLLSTLALVRIFATTEKLADWRLARKCVWALFGLAVLCMAFAALPFAFQQLRHGLYPQYDQSGVSYAARQSAVKHKAKAGAVPRAALPKVTQKAAPKAAQEAVPRNELDSVLQEEYATSLPLRSHGKMARMQKAAPAKKQMLYDPEALVQTGPGRPDWQWRQVRLQWNGPVAQEERLALWLLSPGWNLVLHAARAVLLLAVLVPLVDVRRWLPAPGGRNFSFSAALLLLAPVLAVSLAASPARAEQFPPQRLLDAYAKRLTAPAPCFPHCAAASSLRIQLQDKRLRLVAEFQMAARAVVPLPLVSERWRPETTLLDAAPAVLRSEQGTLYALVPSGVHTVTMEGLAPENDAFTISFASLRPKLAEVSAPGWEVQGIGPDKNLQGALRFAKRQKTEARKDALRGYTIPPFLDVRRELVLGLNWEVTTRVKRLSPKGQPIVERIPLLPGESVLTEGIKVKDNKALINLASDAETVSWRSRLEISPELRLAAPTQVPWMEQWSVNASRIWELQTTGIPPVKVFQRGQWTPIWRPWPGETLDMAVTRPKTAPGASMTITSVDYALKAGSRLDESILTLDIRASKGGRHRIAIPPDATVTQLEKQGQSLPRIGMESGEIEFPYSPGRQSVTIAWRDKKESPGRIQAPAVNLKQKAVNVRMRYTVPKDRWILFVRDNPLMGSQVRFWSYCIAVLIGAFLLGLLPWSPLKRWQWFLLGLGLTQVGVWTILFAVFWLFALEFKQRHYPRRGWFGYDALQLILAALVIAGLVNLYQAVHQGLLGQPATQLTNYAGYAPQYTLQWMQDRITGALPRPQVLSAPLWVYRVLMLVWSLWLAISLLRWWRWGWGCLSEGGVLRKPVFSAKQRIRRRAEAKEQEETPTL